MLLIRDSFTKTTTLGKLWLNGDFFCYTLEDAYRGKNVKIPNETAIAEGTYEVKVTMSNRFKRLMPLLYGVPNFTGIRMHGGNNHNNTSGCILCAFKTDEVNIWQTAEKELTEALVNFNKIYITIINRQGK